MENINCFFCHQQILADEIKSELPCHHFMHTPCLLRYTFAYGNQCEVCNELIDPFLQETHSIETPTIDFENLISTNEEFKTLVSTIVKQHKILQKKRTAFQKVIREKKDDIKEEVQQLKQQIKELCGTKRLEVQSSVECKEFVKEKRKYFALLQECKEKYNCEQSSLMYYLKQKPGSKSFTYISSYFISTTRLLRRAFTQ